MTEQKLPNLQLVKVLLYRLAKDVAVILLRAGQILGHPHRKIGHQKNQILSLRVNTFLVIMRIFIPFTQRWKEMGFQVMQ